MEPEMDYPTPQHKTSTFGLGQSCQWLDHRNHTHPGTTFSSPEKVEEFFKIGNTHLFKCLPQQTNELLPLFHQRATACHRAGFIFMLIEADITTVQ